MDKINKVSGNDIFNILLDENNDSDLVLLDNDGKEVVFEQIMTIPYHDEYLDKEDIYCILHPKTKSKWFDTNQVYPFKVHKDEDGSYSLQDVEDKQVLKYLEKVYQEME